MSADLTSLIAEHKLIGNHCWCGRTRRLSQHEHAEHVAAVIEDSGWLAARDRETAAGAVEAAADEAEAIDGAAFTASFPAESGLPESERQECIDSADALLEAPWDWLRDRAQAIREGGTNE